MIFIRSVDQSILPARLATSPENKKGNQRQSVRTSRIGILIKHTMYIAMAFHVCFRLDSTTLPLPVTRRTLRLAHLCGRSDLVDRQSHIHRLGFGAACRVVYMYIYTHTAIVSVSLSLSLVEHDDPSRAVRTLGLAQSGVRIYVHMHALASARRAYNTIQYNAIQPCTAKYGRADVCACGRLEMRVGSKWPALQAQSAKMRIQRWRRLRQRGGDAFPLSLYIYIYAHSIPSHSIHPCLFASTYGRLFTYQPLLPFSGVLSWS